MRLDTKMDSPPPLPAEPADFSLRFLAHLIDTALWTALLTSIMLGLFWKDLCAWFNEAMALAMQGVTTQPQPPELPLWFSIIFQYVIPVMLLVTLWRWKAATPGKMMLGLKLVDAQTGGKLSFSQCTLRTIGYFPPMIPLSFLSMAGIAPDPMLFVGAAIFTCPLLWGFLSILTDPRKQGWHDKMARSLVVKSRP